MNKKLRLWKSFSSLTLGLAYFFFSSCDNEDGPMTLPTVTTTTITEITTNSAKAGGEITGDGNSKITASGLVYSSAVTQPTLADDKTVTTSTEWSFTSTLEGLTSGTVYHVRAYATNSVGTSYGAVVDFTTGNKAPTAVNLSVSGTVNVGDKVTAKYTFSDAESDPQGESTFKWYVATDGTGTGEAIIDGETGPTYIIGEADLGKFIRFGVTPMAVSGNTTGTEIKSTFAGPVGGETTVTFPYNGQSVTYGIINSTTTGRKWLDRNLGAPNAPTAVDDYANYGDLFEWGRLADGHQLISRKGPNDTDMSLVNSTVGPVPAAFVSVDVPNRPNFILLDGTQPVDWRNPQNPNLWQGVNGINNPCPSGWRIPTEAEWEAEQIGTVTGAYEKLKLTFTGQVDFYSGKVISLDFGHYWSSSIGIAYATYSRRIQLSSSPYEVVDRIRSSGNACRCIKD